MFFSRHRHNYIQLMSSEEPDIMVTILHGTLGNLSEKEVCRLRGLCRCVSGQVEWSWAFDSFWNGLWRKASWLAARGDARPSSSNARLLWACSCIAPMLQACLCMCCAPSACHRTLEYVCPFLFSTWKRFSCVFPSPYSPIFLSLCHMNCLGRWKVVQWNTCTVPFSSRWG